MPPSPSEEPPTVLSDILDIEHDEAQLDALDSDYQTRRQALVDQIAAKRTATAAKMGEGRAVMKSPGDNAVIISLGGKLHAVKVEYLTTPAPAESTPTQMAAATPASA